MPPNAEVSATALYKECIEAANTCTRRAHQLAEAGTQTDEYASLQSKNYAQSALALVQAAVTIHKASMETKASRR